MLTNVNSVLVVDDSRVMRESLVSLLGRHFDRVLSASSCTEAIAAIDAQDEIDLVICDVYMPDGMGLEVLEFVHGRPGRKPEVILVTARWEEAHAARAVALDARGYLAKSVSLGEIRLCLKISPQVQRRVLGADRRGLAHAWILDPAQGEHRLTTLRSESAPLKASAGRGRRSS